jgi:hypothetical protein
VSGWTFAGTKNQDFPDFEALSQTPDWGWSVGLRNQTLEAQA